jgi:hypothetical protein
MCEHGRIRRSAKNVEAAVYVTWQAEGCCKDYLGSSAICQTWRAEGGIAEVLRHRASIYCAVLLNLALLITVAQQLRHCICSTGATQRY